jgi:hypothetical protein
MMNKEMITVDIINKNEKHIDNNNIKQFQTQNSNIKTSTLHDYF